MPKMSISGVVKVGGGAEEARAAAGALEEPAEASRDGRAVEVVATRAETPSVEDDFEVEVVETVGAAARIFLKATRSARPREQVTPMSPNSITGVRPAATSITGARQGGSENGSRVTMAVDEAAPVTAAMRAILGLLASQLGGTAADEMLHRQLPGVSGSTRALAINLLLKEAKIDLFKSKEGLIYKLKAPNRATPISGDFLCGASSSNAAGQGSFSSTTGAASLVTGARQGDSENSGRCIAAAPGEGARFQFRKVRRVRFEGVDDDRVLQENKTEPKKCTTDSEGVGEKVMALESDIKVLKEKKETKENLKAAIEVRKKKHLEEMRKVANESKEIKEMENDFKKMETDIGAKLEQKEEELKKVLEEAVVQVSGPSPSPEGRHLTFLLASIDRKAASLECPVCLEEAAAPVFGCSQFHVLCGGCRGKVAACPTCREEFPFEGPKRNRFAEERAEELEALKEELRAATS